MSPIFLAPFFRPNSQPSRFMVRCPSTMKSNTLKIALGLVLSVVLLYLFGRTVDWKEVPAQIVNVSVPLFLLAVPLFALNFFTRAARWHVLVAREKVDVRFRNLVAANIVGFTVNFVFPGRLGELAKPLYLARKEDLKPGFTIGTVVVERLFDVVTMCLLLGLFMLARPLFAGSWPIGPEAGERLTFLGTLGIVAAAAILAVILFLYFFKDRALRVVGFLLKPFPEKGRAAALSLLGEFIDGLRFFRTRSQLGLYAVLSLVVWLGIILFYWAFFAAYHIHLPYFLVIPYVFMTGVGASIPTPGMVGGFHYFSQLGLVLLLRLDPARAAGLTVVVHALQIVVTCALGYAILAREGLSLIQLTKMGESERP
jgi:uncharacterized protein (TIRG00374 family)